MQHIGEPRSLTESPPAWFVTRLHRIKLTIVSDSLSYQGKHHVNLPVAALVSSSSGHHRRPLETLRVCGVAQTGFRIDNLTLALPRVGIRWA